MKPNNKKKSQDTPNIINHAFWASNHVCNTIKDRISPTRQNSKDPSRFDRNAAFQTAGLTLKPSKVLSGPKKITCLGDFISGDDISVGKDCIKSIAYLHAKYGKAKNIPNNKYLACLRAVKYRSPESGTQISRKKDAQSRLGVDSMFTETILANPKLPA